MTKKCFWFLEDDQSSLHTETIAGFDKPGLTNRKTNRVSKTNKQAKSAGGRPTSYDPKIIHTIVAEALNAGVPADEIDTLYVKGKLVREEGMKPTVRPETLASHVAAAHADIAEAENRKLLHELPDGIVSAVDNSVAAAGKELLLVVARQHAVSQALAEQVCDELRQDKRNAQHRAAELEGQLAEAKETQNQLELEKSELAEQLATVQEELRIALFDLERLKEGPSVLEQFLDVLGNQEHQHEIRAALAQFIRPSSSSVPE